ncbi:hypothetical protein CFB44_29760 [Burkholderia sp. AU31280]|uniref:AAA family ATPase n=2 Tax=Burkholderiaceae TaxID=119060 RepID=UPI0009B1F3FF|nr:hypothetical protein CFB44_29760 [Burkholderia sp. AU31280]
MLISSLTMPPEAFAHLGLQKIHMTRLGRFVAIAGKNGAGKSRLLRGLESVVSARTAERLGDPQGCLRDAMSWQANIDAKPQAEHVPAWQAQVDVHTFAYAACTEFVQSPEAEAFRLLNFVPKVLELDDPRKKAFGDIATRSKDATSIGHREFHTTALFYIQNLISEYHDVTHQHFGGSEDEKLRIEARHASFQELITHMLGEPIRRQVGTGYPMIFGLLLGDAQLSDGQKVMLQLCVALHSQEQNLERTVLVFDEPENHLHPSAVVDVVKAVYERTTTTQIWVATHSVPLLAYMSRIDPMCLWYMEKGAISHAGKNPEIVLGSLLGGEDGISELRAFTNLPVELASVRYASESLLPPQVIAGGEGDPQVTQIQRQLALLKRDLALPILDFGAGRGRLLEGLAALIEDASGVVRDTLDYYAFDEYRDSHDDCAAVISEHFGTDERLFHKQDDFFAVKDKGSISVVVLTNVLHEIPPRVWVGLFGAGSLIYESLADDGYVLIVEDERIPIGEKAHENGFLVLDTVHLKTMFGATEKDISEKRFVADDARGDGRLKAHLISKILLSNVSTVGVKKAIEELRNTAKREIKSLRSKDPTYKNGQLHGFWTQQFANAALTLDE